MGTRDSARSAVTGSEPSDDPRVLELVKEYEAAWENGRRPARSRFLTRYPDLAPVVSVCLDGVDLLYQEVTGLTHSGRPRACSETGLGGGSRVGEFEIVREIGRGGMGVVYEAVQPALGRRVAVKVLPRSLAADRTRLQRFQVEARAAAAVVHPHIVPVYAVGEDCGVNFYVMRLVDGFPLDALVAATRRPGSGPESQQPVGSDRVAGDYPTLGELIGRSRRNRSAFHHAVARFGAVVARALDHAHQSGIIHRDIKPANLLLGRDGHVWVTDFGLAQFMEAATVTGSGAAVGTLRYMSPEQAAGDRRRLDHRTDVYSLAATLYELSTGRPAFPAEEPAALLLHISHTAPVAPRAIDPTVPADLETVLLKGLEKDPRDRYATAAEFADDLDRFLTGRPVTARRPSAWDRARKWAGRHPAIIGSVGIFLLVLALASSAIVALALRAYRAERNRADEAEQRMVQSKKLGELIIRISEEEGLSNGSFYGPRRLLLLAALDNYRQLSETGRDDPDFHAEMNRMKARIEVLLAKEKAARESWRVCLLWLSPVRVELGLSRDQDEQLRREFGSRGLDLAAVGASLRDAQDDPHLRDNLRSLLSDPVARQELLRPLTEPQRNRLGELFLQSNGPRAFSDPDVMESLALTPVQRQQIRLIQRPAGRLDLPFFTPNEGYLEGMKTAAARTEKILELLTTEQRSMWVSLIGRPFNMPW